MWECSSGKLIQSLQTVNFLNSDAFYIQFFQAAFPNIDFSQL